MAHDWLLVETLGSEPAVVANGRSLEDMVPISEFLRRSPHLTAIQTAVAETVATGTSLASLTPKGKRVIRTEPVKMTDGTVHGVHVWIGRADDAPPERPVPGPMVWNLTTGVATDTPQSLINSGLDPDTNTSAGRAFAEDLPARRMHPQETRLVSRALLGEPGSTYCSSWNVTDCTGRPITVSFVTRVNLEVLGTAEQQVARAMNWRG